MLNSIGPDVHESLGMKNSFDSSPLTCHAVWTLSKLSQVSQAMKQWKKLAGSGNLMFVVHSNAPEFNLVSAHSNLTTAKGKEYYQASPPYNI